jgi:TolB-like protein
MFTDIVGYTALMGKDEVRAMALLKRNIQIQKPLIESFNGDLLKEMGDGILASFLTVSDAVYCAGAIQNACEAEEDLSLRIGIHLGEVVFEGHDVFGDGVNIASRIEAIAPSGGIWVSESVHKNVLNKKGIETSFVRESQLKNVSETVRIYEAKVESVEAAPISVKSPDSAKTNPRKILLVVLGVLSALSLAYLGTNYFMSTDEAKQQTVEKSIAVIPFISLSDDPEKQYLADGVMDAILLHLSKIENLRVITRTSVERYRNTQMSIPEIATELNVQNVLEGSFQKHGDQANLIVQLSNAQQDEDHLWADEYQRDWSNIFAVQSEVAQTIAGQLKAVITPEERELIEKVPTTDLTAYDFYQRGRSEHLRYWLDNKQQSALENAEKLYYNAIEYDSTFALAYTGLAHVYWNKHYWDAFLSQSMMDTMKKLVNIALAFDDKLAEAHVLKGNYFRYNYKKEQALSEYIRAIEYDPNSSAAHWQIGRMHYHDDLVKTIDYFQKAISLYSGPFLPHYYRRTGKAYAIAGFKDKAISCAHVALKLDGDTANYFRLLMEIEDGAGNPKKSIEFGERSYAKDSTASWTAYLLGIQHMFLGENEEYLRYMEKHQDLQNALNDPSPFTMFRVGHAYWVNGYEEQAKEHFEAGQKFYDDMIKLGRHFAQDLHTYYNLASINAFLSNKEKAYEYLGIVNQRTRMPRWMTKDIKNDPLFDNLRGEPEFEQIVDDIVSKYHAEHERVRGWLEKEGLL